MLLHQDVKNVPDMTYNVFDGTLNPALAIYLSSPVRCTWTLSGYAYGLKYEIFYSTATIQKHQSTDYG